MLKLFVLLDLLLGCLDPLPPNVVCSTVYLGSLLKLIFFFAGIPLLWFDSYVLLSKGFVLLAHRIQEVAFGFGQLLINSFHLDTASFGRPENLSAGRRVRWCTYYVNSRIYEKQFMDLFNETSRYKDLKVIWSKYLQSKLTEYAEGERFENASPSIFQSGIVAEPPSKLRGIEKFTMWFYSKMARKISAQTIIGRISTSCLYPIRYKGVSDRITFWDKWKVTDERNLSGLLWLLAQARRGLFYERD